jgi:DNA polymerase
MNARAILHRYLLQQLEAGEEEIFLDGLDAAEVLAMLRPLPAARGRAGLASGAGAGDRGIGQEAGVGARGGGHEGAGASAADLAAAGAGRLLQALAEHAPGVLGQGGGGAAMRGSGTASGTGMPGEERGGEGVRQRDQASGDSGALRILGEEVAGCMSCRLHEGRRHVVFGEGSGSAEVVVVGEAPGREEDRTGRPFVGPAGKLLDLLLLSVGLPREDVYICNVLKCRPPENRDPAADEVEACSAHLRRQLDAIRPTVLLAVGKFAAQTLTGSEESIGSLRGGVHRYHGIPLVVTYHPAFLLRSPQWTRAAWSDLQLLREVLEASRGGV